MKKISNFKFQISNKTGGFTLIELLLVITILGVLSTFIFANFVGVRQRARDGQRKSDIAQIQSALEFFRSDNGCYPGTGCPALGAMPACGSSLSAGGVTYMQRIPCDPTVPSAAPYTYTYSGGGASYTLRACLENTNDMQKDATNAIPPCTGTSRSFTRTNP